MNIARFGGMLLLRGTDEQEKLEQQHAEPNDAKGHTPQWARLFYFIRTWLTLAAILTRDQDRRMYSWMEALIHHIA
jgi:hypothetical protein